jgi:hypothetical protein
MKERRGLWQRIKEFPPFIASIIGIVAAIVGVVTWVTGYFATREQVTEVACWSQINNQIDSRQIAQTLLIGQRFELRTLIRELEKKELHEGLTEHEKDSLNQGKQEYEDIETKLRAARDAALELQMIIRSGKVVDSNGECRGSP